MYTGVLQPSTSYSNIELIDTYTDTEASMQFQTNVNTSIHIQTNRDTITVNIWQMSFNYLGFHAFSQHKMSVIGIWELYLVSVLVSGIGNKKPWRRS